MISEQWLDMYHRARSAGMTHATAMKILVDPEELSEREAVIAQLSKPPCPLSAFDAITEVFHEGVKCEDEDVAAYRKVHRHLRDWWERQCGRPCPTEPNPAPPDPYARFSDAIREGKRVFCELQFPDKLMMAAIGSKEPDRFDVRGLFIEGVDIPPQPSQDWLDAHSVELTGECRLPKAREGFVGVGLLDVMHLGAAPRDCKVENDDTRFSGHRWIVRKKAKQTFDQWIDSMSSDTLRNALNSDHVARCTVRALWEAVNP